MKVLLDEMLPIGVRQLLPEHQVMTAAYVGLAGVSNGEMISRAISDGFDVIVSLDRGIPHQQNLDRYAVGFVLIPAKADPLPARLEWWQARPYQPKAAAPIAPPYVRRAKREAQATLTPRTNQDRAAEAVRAREAELDRRWQSEKDRTRRERAQVERALLAAEERARNTRMAVRRSTPSITRVTPTGVTPSDHSKQPTPSPRKLDIPANRVAGAPKPAQARPEPIAGGLDVGCPHGMSKANCAHCHPGRCLLPIKLRR